MTSRSTTTSSLHQLQYKTRSKHTKLKTDRQSRDRFVEESTLRWSNAPVPQVELPGRYPSLYSEMLTVFPSELTVSTYAT